MSIADSNCYKIKLLQFSDSFSNKKLITKIDAINPSEVILLIDLIKINI